MTIRADLTGRRFGKLIVTGWNQEALKWECRCDCGGVRLARREQLLTYATSCGCGLRYKSRGGVKLPYKTWGMKDGEKYDTR